MSLHKEKKKVPIHLTSFGIIHQGEGDLHSPFLSDSRKGCGDFDHPQNSTTGGEIQVRRGSVGKNSLRPPVREKKPK